MKTEVNNVLEGEEVGQVKMSKIEKFFASQKAKLNEEYKGSVNSLFEKFNNFSTTSDAKLNNFILGANATIKRTDDKFSGMYNFLVKQFLTNLEDRTYTLELSNKAVVQLLADKLHQLEVKQGSTLSKEEYITELEGLFLSKMTEIHNASVKATEEAKAAAELKEENVEPSQEVVEPAVPEQTTASEETAVQ
jgi:hypothetical protein